MGQEESEAAAGVLQPLNLLQNFEAAVRENVTINGQPWGDASASSEPCGTWGCSLVSRGFRYLFVLSASWLSVRGAGEVELRLGFV